MSEKELLSANETAQDMAEISAAIITQKSTIENHDVALILGSGWGSTAETLGKINADIFVENLPGFHSPVVAGHSGRIISTTIETEDKRSLNALIFLGRTHLYEGYGVDACVHRIRVAAAAGCSSVVLTNAAGSLREEWAPGSIVVMNDHINLTGVSPLNGGDFIDMTNAYSTQLQELVRTIEPNIPSGVYVQLMGPSYETPAEVRMLRYCGADLVGMSTVVETIMARSLGLQVLGLSLITNYAAGVADTALDHHEVLEIGSQSSESCANLIKNILHKL